MASCGICDHGLVMVLGIGEILGGDCCGGRLLVGGLAVDPAAQGFNNKKQTLGGGGDACGTTIR